MSDSVKPLDRLATRRSHLKSRSGCAECRRRRVKCDEKKPACDNCARRSASCKYPSTNHGPPSPRSQPSPQARSTSGVGIDSSRSPLLASGNSPASLSSDRPTFTPNSTQSAVTVDGLLKQSSGQDGFDLFDIELWNHWSMVVGATMSDGSADDIIAWRDKVNEVAFAHGYVARLLLALSALHLARGDPSRAKACTIRSDALQAAAINDVVPALTNLDADNVRPLWLAASMLCACSLAKGPQPGVYLLYADDGRSEWPGLMQGVKSLTSQYSMSTLTDLVQNKDINERSSLRLDPEEVVPGVGKALHDLRSTIDALCAEDEIFQKYVSLVDALSTYFSIVFGRTGDSSEVLVRSHYVFAWLYRLEDDFVSAVQVRRPMALVIFAHFLVLFSLLKKLWYVDGWALHTLEAISAHLHPAYQHWLQWPRQMIARDIPSL